MRYTRIETHLDEGFTHDNELGVGRNANIGDFNPFSVKFTLVHCGIRNTTTTCFRRNLRSNCVFECFLVLLMYVFERCKITNLNKKFEAKGGREKQNG